MNFFETFESFDTVKDDMFKLTEAAIEAFVRAQHDEETFDLHKIYIIDVEKISDNYVAKLSDRTCFVLKKLNKNRVEIIPYELVIEGNFTLPIKNVITFFKQAGEIYKKHASFNVFSKGKKIDWSKAKSELENLVAIYTSDKLVKLNNTGILTD